MCALCQETYNTKLSDVEVLKCVMCNQSAHNPCIAKLFQIEEQDLLDLSPEEIKTRMNPCKIPGMHYMCKECEERTIPSDDVGKLKKTRQ